MVRSAYPDMGNISWEAGILLMQLARQPRAHQAVRPQKDLSNSTVRLRSGRTAGVHDGFQKPALWARLHIQYVLGTIELRNQAYPRGPRKPQQHHPALKRFPPQIFPFHFPLTFYVEGLRFNLTGHLMVEAKRIAVVRAVLHSFLLSTSLSFKGFLELFSGFFFFFNWKSRVTEKETQIDLSSSCWFTP